MQIRHASFPAGALPPCPFDHEPEAGGCLQNHGHYKRYAQPEGTNTIRIARLRCKFTGKTISILPDGMLPYRAISVRAVEEHFDTLSGIGPAPEGENDAPDVPARSERVQACLSRSWRRLSSTPRVASLTNFFGQRLPRTESATALWKAIRATAGRLGQILLELARQGKSLLGDYQCLTPS